MPQRLQKVVQELSKSTFSVKDFFFNLSNLVPGAITKLALSRAPTRLHGSSLASHSFL